MSTTAALESVEASPAERLETLFEELAELTGQQRDRWADRGYRR